MDGRDDTGASAVEYGLLMVAIVAVIAAVAYAFGPVVISTFERGTCAMTPGQTSATVC